MKKREYNMDNQTFDTHFQELFALLLGIKEPWYIKDFGLVPSLKDLTVIQMHINVDFREGSNFGLCRLLRTLQSL